MALTREFVVRERPEIGLRAPSDLACPFYGIGWPGSVGDVGTVDKTPQTDPRVEESVFGDVPAKIAQAVNEAVAEHRREGRLIPVDRGNGVELIP